MNNKTGSKLQFLPGVISSKSYSAIFRQTMFHVYQLEVFMIA